MPARAMTPEAVLTRPEAGAWVAAVYRQYEQLVGGSPLDPEQGLGGRLIFAGAFEALDSPADALVAAANIAGAATLVAAPESAAQRRAMRDALVDFVVNSMDEALRILKNEIRQRRAVSVAVTISAEHLVEEMLRRGVQPEAAVEAALPDRMQSQWQGLLLRAQRLTLAPEAGGVFVEWKREACCAEKPSVEEARALAMIADPARLRWLRLAPRYLGRAAQRTMGVGLSASEAEGWTKAVRAASKASGGQRLEVADEGGHSETGL